MELSGYGIGKTLEGDAFRNAIDYRLYSCNHYHLDFWEQAKERTPRGYARHALENVTSLIKSGKADCIAHPLTAGYVRTFEDKTLASRAITDNELGDIMALAKEHEVAMGAQYRQYLRRPGVQPQNVEHRQRNGLVLQHGRGRTSDKKYRLCTAYARYEKDTRNKTVSIAAHKKRNPKCNKNPIAFICGRVFAVLKAFYKFSSAENCRTRLIGIEFTGRMVYNGVT